MADEATTEVAPTPDPAEAPEELLGDAGKKALDAMKRDRNDARSEANALKAQLDLFKQSQMSDLEKAQTLAADAQKVAAQAQAEALRWRIAAKHGISDDDAETFLTGSDEATLTRQAERLSQMAATASTAPPTPKPDLTQGQAGNPLPLNSDGLENALREKLGI